MPILCIGETKKENIEGQTKNALRTQLEIIKDCNLHDLFTVAYEPVWAIGTGKTPEVNLVNDIHEHIKDVVQSSSANNIEPKVIYGGSVSHENAEGFLGEINIDGALIGGASLKANSFADIVKIYRKVKRKW